MRFGIIYYGKEVKNRGLDQLAQCLYALGHEPFIVARRPKSGRIITEFNDIPVIQLPLHLGRLANIADAFLPLNWNWERWIINLARQYKWQGLFLRETPLSWQVLVAGRKLRVPVFLDMRENLGAMYQAGQAKNLLLRVVRWRPLVQLYESMTIRHFCHIFVSTKELEDWVLSNYCVPLQKVSVLENTPHDRFLLAAEKALQGRPLNDGLMRLVYAGNIKESKGIGDVISAIPHVLSECPLVRLRIIGEGPALERMKMLVRELNLANKIEFLPRLSMPELVKSLSECDIGIESCWLNELTHQTLPGKLFEYMTLGLPVLSSARKPVIRILSETECGRVYHSREPKNIARVLIEMLGDKEKLNIMGRKARQAVLKRYNWRSNLSVLNNHIFPYRCFRKSV